MKTLRNIGESPRRPWVRLLGLVGMAAVLVPAVVFAIQQTRYDREFPMIGYETGVPRDSVARLQSRVAAGDAELTFSGDTGYLESLLSALDIDPSSQTLAFSKTSLQVANISPDAPRAIYFNDDTYVAFVQNGVIEISTVDPELGVVFYTLQQNPSISPRFERETIRCLQCHDSFSLTGGGVPRHLVGSGLVGPTGDLASHEGRFLTDDTTPLRRRWGGWYVTGTHGSETHRGNLIILDAEHARTLDLADTGNVTNLRTLFDVEPYLTGTSDIVALLVLEHQTHVQNAVTRLNWETRRLLSVQGVDAETAAGGSVSPAIQAQIDEWAEPLVEALFMVGQPRLESAIAGTSGFREHFESLGPADDAGRSLRDLDLETRIFRYPFSYVAYGDAFAALPEVAGARVVARVREVLSGTDRSSAFAHLTAADRAAIGEILEATWPAFRSALP